MVSSTPSTPSAYLFPVYCLPGQHAGEQHSGADEGPAGQVEEGLPR